MSPGRGGELERIHVERNIYVAMVWTVFWDASYETQVPQAPLEENDWWLLPAMGDVSYAKSGRESMTIGGEWFGGENKVFVDVGEGLPTVSSPFSGQCWSFPGPESQESKIVCIFFPRSIWSLGVPPFDPGEKSWSAKLIRVISADPHLTPPCINPRPKPRNRKSSVSSSLDRFGAWEYHHSIRVKILDRLCENKFWKKS